MLRRIILFLSLILFLPVMLNAATVQLPETGQANCYDSAGNVIDCAGTGQDGEIRAGAAWPSPRFADNGDQTVTDRLTGLIWSQDGNAPGPAVCNPGITKTWQEALDYVVCLNNSSYLGFTDWRLPNVVELESLVNAQQNTATWLIGEGFSNVPSYYPHWSSTSSGYPVVVQAWYVYMGGGSVGGYPKTYSYYAWPVRGGQSGVVQLPKTGQTICFDIVGNVIECVGTGQDGEIQAGTAWPNPRFSINGDQTVTDNLTGLMWSQSANSPGPSACNPGAKRNWQGALDYVGCLNANSYLGFNDWRLPNRKEMLSLIYYPQPGDALLYGYFYSIQDLGYYWTATTYPTSPASAFNLLIQVGLSYGEYKQYSKVVWPVRNAGQLSVLSVVKTGAGTGNVTPNIGSLVWNGNTGTKSYAQGTTVSLTAAPNAGNVFSGWNGGGCSGTGSCTVTLGADTAVTASFDLGNYTVTPAAGANGSLNPNTPQVVIGGDITSFTVAPDAGYRISSISGCGGSLSGNTYITGPITVGCIVSASFELIPPQYTLMLTLSGNGTGAVHSLPAPDINCTTGTCGQGYESGTVVTLTATPNSGATFDHWSGACSGSGVTCQVTMDTAKSVDVRFKK